MKKDLVIPFGALIVLILIIFGGSYYLSTYSRTIKNETTWREPTEQPPQKQMGIQPDVPDDWAAPAKNFPEIQTP